MKFYHGHILSIIYQQRFNNQFKQGEYIMKKWIGKSLLVIGIIHTVFGIVVYQGVICELAKEFLINSIGRQPERLAAFWFFITGFCLMIIGGLINWIEKKKIQFPPFLKWVYMALTISGCIMMPASGLWLMLIPGAGLFLKSHSHP